MQFADKLSIQNATNLLLKYRNFLQLDSMSCVWYHGIFLHEFPLSNGRSLSRKVFGTSTNNDLSFHDYCEHVKQIPALTYSLSWCTQHMSAVKHPPALKLCLSSILSEISIGNEHDIVINFPIQYAIDNDCYYIINDLITNKSYFPFVAFNFFNIHHNLHNFNFSRYYKLMHQSKQQNGKNGYHHHHHNGNISQTQNESSSWNIFGGGGGGKKKTQHNSPLPYDSHIGVDDQFKRGTHCV